MTLLDIGRMRVDARTVDAEDVSSQDAVPGRCTDLFGHGLISNAMLSLKAERIMEKTYIRIVWQDPSSAHGGGNDIDQHNDSDEMHYKKLCSLTINEESETFREAYSPTSFCR